MIGFTKEEGLVYTTRFINHPEFDKHFRDNWNTCAPISLFGKESNLISEEDVKYANNPKESYTFTDGEIELADLTTLFTDANFALSSHRVAKHLPQRNMHVYKYVFSYRGQKTNNIINKF